MYFCALRLQQETVQWPSPWGNVLLTCTGWLQVMTIHIIININLEDFVCFKFSGFNSKKFLSGVLYLSSHYYNRVFKIDVNTQLYYIIFV